LNTIKYFGTFAHNADSFLEFTTIETIRGRAIQFYQAAGFDVLLPYRQSSSAIHEFIARDYRNKNDTRFDELHPFPLYTDTPIALLLDPNENNWIWQAAQQLYPSAEFRMITPHDYGIPDNTELLNIIEMLPTTGTEVAGAMSEIGLFTTEYSAYQFDVSRGSIRVNNQVIDRATQLIQLHVGYHSLQTDLSLDNLYWKLPDQAEWEQIPQTNLLPDATLAGQGLHASIYKDNRLILERIDPTLFAYFYEIPVERPYEVIWSANLQVPATGEYTFRIEATGLVEFIINDEILLSGQNINASQTIYLEGNMPSALQIRFTDNQDNSRIFLQWRPPDTSHFQPIPPWNLTPQNQDN
jgi:hypothetical protein